MQIWEMQFWSLGPLQYPCLKNPMDRGAWPAMVHRVAKSQTKVKWLGIQIAHVVQSLSHVRLFKTPWTAAHQDFPIPHYHLEFAQTHVHWLGGAIQPSHPLLLLSPPALNFSQHQVFANESALHIRWPKYWSFSFSISPSNEYSGLISFRID